MVHRVLTGLWVRDFGPESIIEIGDEKRIRLFRGEKSDKVTADGMMSSMLSKLIEADGSKRISNNKGLRSHN